MHLHRRSLRLVALAVVVALPLLGMSGVATAKVKAKAKGCHKTHTCKSGGGTGSGTGTGGTPAPITVQIDPNPAIETGSSYVAVVIQVETSPSFAGDNVDLSSPQFAASCHFTEIGSWSVQPGSTNTLEIMRLDNDGNATAIMYGENCAPGQSVVEADLAAAPYYTALGSLTVAPPVVTTSGVFGFPTSSGTVTGGEVETGDVGLPANESGVVSVFYVETSPVYAEQPVEISSAQLQDRCGNHWILAPLSAVVPPITGTSSLGAGSVFVSPNTTATTTLDDDGNAVFYFAGTSCAAGSSQVIADVMAGTHPTYTTTFTVLPPAPTI